MSCRNVFGLAVSLIATSALAQGPTIEIGQIRCLPNQENAALTARVSPEVPGGQVRLYFRRLNPVRPFYYNEMFPAGGGSYWSVFPKPEDREHPDLTDDWWEDLKDRDWLQGRDRDWLEQWMEEEEHEAAEFYLAVHDGSGQRVARSDFFLVEVWDPGDCQVELDPKEQGWSKNLTIGETNAAQAGKQVFHWLCDGIVTRVDPNEVLRADEYCRACVLALIPPWILPTAGAVAGGLVVVELLEDDDGAETSPFQP